MTPVMGEMLDEASIRALRVGKTVTSVSASDVIGTADPVAALPEPVPVDPRAAFEAGKERVLQSFLDDPVKFQLLCDMLRVRHPEFALLSNEQLRSVAFAMYDAALRQATDEAYRKLGREHELQIKTEGF